MFSNLFDHLICIRETTSVSSLPEEQVKMIDVFKDHIDDLPRKFESQKFWMMGDGGVIPVDVDHADTSWVAGVGVEDLLKSGAIRGQIVIPWPKGAALAIEMWNKPTDDQVQELVILSKRYSVRVLIIDNTFDEDRESYETELKSPEQLEYILRYGRIKEATLGDIKRKQRSVAMLFPTFDDRVKNVQLMGGVRLKDMDDDNWHFQVHSGTKKEIWYDCTLHFKDIQEQLERLVKDRRLWVDDRSRVDLRKLAAAFIEKVNIQAFCSCPAFLYYGSSYILGRPKYDAKYTEPENRPPRHRNPKQYGAVCKHYQNVLKVLPFYTGTIAKWLRDVYARDIAGYQKEAMRDFGWIQKAAGALAKRKARVERPRPRPRPEEKPEPKPEAEPEETTYEGPSEEEPTRESRLV